MVHVTKVPHPTPNTRTHIQHTRIHTYTRACTYTHQQNTDTRTHYQHKPLHARTHAGRQAGRQARTPTHTTNTHYQHTPPTLHTNARAHTQTHTHTHTHTPQPPTTHTHTHTHTLLTRTHTHTHTHRHFFSLCFFGLLDTTHTVHAQMMIIMKFQLLFITLLLAMASCSGKPNAFGEGE